MAHPIAGRLGAALWRSEFLRHLSMQLSVNDDANRESETRTLSKILMGGAGR